MRGDLIGQRSETVRRANLSAIVRELHVSGPLSRSELGADTGLTRTGIRGLVSELSRSEFVFEERASSHGAPGRPSVVVRPNLEAAAVLALEIAVDSLAVAVVGLGGTVRHLQRVDRPRDRLEVDATVADLAELVRLVPAWPPLGDARIGVGVAVVGVTRRTDGFVSIAPN
ncbi:MAG: sugar kinase, partial [Candidatus Limnocylindrales bacterium]